ncbi:MAG: hypothetical protein HWD60_10845 [Defluviicoccus sp.]|nr:MAG: hypothetical protein HWD60_10845 [Defluviicoccus sp.]
MWKLAALAFYPSQRPFCLLALGIIFIFGRTHDFELGAALYYGAAVVSVLLAAPAAWLVARRMLTRREKRLLDAHAGTGR